MQAVKNLISKPIINRHSTGLMGTDFEISVVSNDAGWAVTRINSAIAEIKRIEKLLTPLTGDSQTNLINHNAGIAPVKVNGELFKLIHRSLEIASVTQGTFDITYGTANGYQKVELNVAESTVFLKEKGMRIYFGGIAKGYAADRAKYILQLEGVSNGVINAGGNLVTWGLQPDGRQWTFAAADPEQQMLPYAEFNISNMAVTTLANNGNEALSGSMQSVCVMAASAELAGAMTSPVGMLGIKAGTELINRLQQMACVFVDEYNQMFASKYMDALNGAL